MNLQLEVYLPNVETKRDKYERKNTFIIMFLYGLNFVQVLIVIFPPAVVPLSPNLSLSRKLLNVIRYPL